MARVKVTFDIGGVPVLVGAEPPAPDIPILQPADSGGITNKMFTAPAGMHCYTLGTDLPFTPLWQTITAINGTMVECKFDLVTFALTVHFDGGDVPVLVGTEPASPDVEIANPADSRGTTNSAFHAPAGTRCYTLDTDIPFAPRWQTVIGTSGKTVDLIFKKVQP